MSEHNICELCGEPMPPGEEMFKFHGYSGPCPKPPHDNRGNVIVQDNLASALRLDAIGHAPRRAERLLRAAAEIERLNIDLLKERDCTMELRAEVERLRDWVAFIYNLRGAELTPMMWEKFRKFIETRPELLIEPEFAALAGEKP